MRIRLLSILFALVFAGPALAACAGRNLIDDMAPAERATLERLVASHPYSTGNLWQAVRGSQTVHVIGTVHVPDSRLAAILDRTRGLVAAADLLILETTTTEQSDMQRRMLETPEIAYLTEGPTLIDLLGEDTWAIAAEELNARGIPPFIGAKFRPWLLGMTLAMPQCALNAIAQGERGLDAALEVAAQTNKVPVETLDDISALLETLSSGTLEEQVEMLKANLTLAIDHEAIMATTLDSYFRGNHRELWEFSRLTMADAGLNTAAFDEMEELLLDGRNRQWAEKYPGLIGSKNAVIAVGAAHLSGETGVLASLARMGFELSPL